MSDKAALTLKLGTNVFKPGKEAHIRIRPGMEKDPRLQPAVRICPAGCYSRNESGEVTLNIDGCVECGTCLIACGADVLVWNYPEGGTGVQFRFG